MNKLDKNKMSKLGTLTVSFLLAFLLWIYVVTTVSTDKTETITGIPVTFTGEEILLEQNLTITEGSGSTISLRLTGQGKSLVNLNADNITASVDVSKIRTAGEYTKTITLSYPGGTNTSLISSAVKTPSELTFTVEELLSREIPVKVSVQATTADGYMMGSCKALVSTVTVKGTRALVESLERAIVIVDDTNLSSSVTKNMDYSIVDTDGNVVDLASLTVDVDSIPISLEVRALKTVPLTVSFESGGGATEANVIWTVDPPSVVLSGEESVLESLNKITVDAVNLSGLTENKTYTMPIVLPDGVTCENGTVTAEITLELTGLATKTIDVSAISFVNEPEGFRAVAGIVSSEETEAETEIYTVPVTVRGPEDVISQLLTANVTLIADLSGFSANAGSYTCENVRAEFSLVTGCGTVGTLSLSFTLMPQQEYLTYLEGLQQN